MPIYEYRCEQGHTFEVMQRMSDGPVVSCQTCEAPVARVFHPIAVHFKGSGFYATDYGSRKRSRELSEAAEGGGKSKEEGGGNANANANAKDEGGKSKEEGGGKSKDEGSSSPSKTSAADSSSGKKESKSSSSSDSR